MTLHTLTVTGINHKQFITFYLYFHCKKHSKIITYLSTPSNHKQLSPNLSQHLAYMYKHILYHFGNSHYSPPTSINNHSRYKTSKHSNSLVSYPISMKISAFDSPHHCQQINKRHRHSKYHSFLVIYHF